MIQREALWKTTKKLLLCYSTAVGLFFENIMPKILSMSLKKFHWESKIFHAIPEMLVPWGSKYFEISGPGSPFSRGSKFFMTRLLLNPYHMEEIYYDTRQTGWAVNLQISH